MFGVPYVTELLSSKRFGVIWGCAAARTVRANLPDLLDRVLGGHIEPGEVFDLTLPLSKAAEG